MKGHFWTKKYLEGFCKDDLNELCVWNLIDNSVKFRGLRQIGQEENFKSFYKAGEWNHSYDNKILSQKEKAAITAIRKSARKMKNKSMEKLGVILNSQEQNDLLFLISMFLTQNPVFRENIKNLLKPMFEKELQKSLKHDNINHEYKDRIIESRMRTNSEILAVEEIVMKNMLIDIKKKEWMLHYSEAYDHVISNNPICIHKKQMFIPLTRQLVLFEKNVLPDIYDNLKPLFFNSLMVMHREEIWSSNKESFCMILTDPLEIVKIRSCKDLLRAKERLVTEQIKIYANMEYKMTGEVDGMPPMNKCLKTLFSNWEENILKFLLELSLNIELVRKNPLENFDNIHDDIKMENELQKLSKVVMEISDEPIKKTKVKLLPKFFNATIPQLKSHVEFILNVNAHIQNITHHLPHNKISDLKNILMKHLNNENFVFDDYLELIGDLNEIEWLNFDHQVNEKIQKAIDDASTYKSINDLKREKHFQNSEYKIKCSPP